MFSIQTNKTLQDYTDVEQIEPRALQNEFGNELESIESEMVSSTIQMSHPLTEALFSGQIIPGWDEFQDIFSKHCATRE